MTAKGRTAAALGAETVGWGCTGAGAGVGGGATEGTGFISGMTGLLGVSPLGGGVEGPSYQNVNNEPQKYEYNTWSSGLFAQYTLMNLLPSTASTDLKARIASAGEENCTNALFCVNLTCIVCKNLCAPCFWSIPGG